MTAYINNVYAGYIREVSPPIDCFHRVGEPSCCVTRTHLHPESLVPSDPACRLERTLAKYTCLTKNETIRIFYNSRTYDIDVVEVAAALCVFVMFVFLQRDTYSVQLKSARGPADAVSIIEADVNVSYRRMPIKSLLQKH